MRKRIEWEWEQLDSVTSRVKVIGGWIVQQVILSSKGQSAAINMVFVPDRDHEWHILPKIKEAPQEEKPRGEVEF